MDREPRNDLIEGRNAVNEAIRAGRALDKLYVSKGTGDPALGRIISKAKELGLEVVASVEEAKQAVQEKLDEAKDEWTETAAEHPNAARRQVRLVWAVLGAVAGLLIGFGLGFVYGRFF